MTTDWTGACVAIVVLAGGIGLVYLLVTVARVMFTFFRFLVRAEKVFNSVGQPPVSFVAKPEKPQPPPPVAYEGFCSCSRRVRLLEGLPILQVIIKDGKHLKEIQCPGCAKKLLLPVKKPGE